MKYLPYIGILMLFAACHTSKNPQTAQNKGPVAGTVNKPDSTERTPVNRIAPSMSSAPIPNPKPLQRAPDPP